MALNLASMHAFIAKEVASKRTLRSSMDRVIARCAGKTPHLDWKELAALPYEDLSKLRKWIQRPFRLEPSRMPLKGLWFGLFNPIYRGKAVAELYVCGSKRFHRKPIDNSWAVGPDWWPEERYSHSMLLAKLYAIAYRDGGLGNDAEYPLCLAYGSLAVRDLVRSIDPAVFLGVSKSLGIAVGFDSGDFVLIGRLSHRGVESLS